MTFKEYHISRREKVQKFIESFLTEYDHKSSDELSHIALERIEDFSTSGKMLRAVFTILSYEMFGNKVDDNALRLGTVMELSQTGILTHDDIMDNDTVRRGKPTMYAQYAQDAQNRDISNPTEYGKSMAMIVGDASYFLTYELIAQLDVASGVRSKIMKRYSREMLKCALGQFIDYDFGKSLKQQSHDDISEMYRLKTGSYTFTLPFVLGAYLGGAEDSQIEVLEEITHLLGKVFQIKDDELGLFGKPDETGKVVGSDIEEGKMTLLRAELYDAATEDEREKLDTIFGSPVSEEDITYIKDVISKYKVVERLDAHIREDSDAAKERLADLSIESSYKELLLELIEYNATRGT